MVFFWFLENLDNPRLHSMYRTKTEADAVCKKVNQTTLERCGSEAWKVQARVLPFAVGVVDDKVLEERLSGRFLHQAEWSTGNINEKETLFLRKY